MNTGRASQTIITRPESGPVVAPFEPNFIDWRASRGRADRRAAQYDDTLEICAHCECEVDITPQPHKPDCRGIGMPRASSAEAVSAPKVESNGHVPVAPEGLDLLDRMDAGLPVGPDAEQEDPPELDLEVDEPVLGEVAAVGKEADSGAADTFLGEPERAATSPSPATQEEPMRECKIDGCTNDASDAPKAGPTARMCKTHRAARGTVTDPQAGARPGA